MTIRAEKKKLMNLMVILLLAVFILIPHPGTAFVIDPKTMVGMLTVNSQPSGVDVTVDGTYRGQTPVTIALQVGTHTLLVRKTGYADITQNVEIISDSSKTVSYVLTATVSRGTLSVDSTPQGATIFIDGIAKGTTPVTVPDFKVGTYTITIKMSGYEDMTEMLNIVAGQTTTFAPVLRPVPATGSLALSSNPPGALVYLDDTYRGITPLTLSGLSAGSHDLTITRDGYDEYSAPITITAGKTTTHAILMSPVSSGPGDDKDYPENRDSGNTGTVTVSTIPAGAAVFLDGVEKGKTPATISGVAPGSHTVKLTLTGYLDDAAAITVSAGQVSPVTVTLKSSEPAAETGTVSISSNPAGARVVINLQDMGVTPLMLTNIQAGTYQIQVLHKEYEPWQETISVGAGATTNVAAALVAKGGGSSAGSLLVTSAPSGASVWFDGTPRGTTPLRIPSPAPGSHTMILEKDGYEKFETTVTVTGGTEQQFAASLVPSRGRAVPGFSGALAVITILCMIMIIHTRRSEKT